MMDTLTHKHTHKHAQFHTQTCMKSYSYMFAAESFFKVYIENPESLFLLKILVWDYILNFNKFSFYLFQVRRGIVFWMLSGEILARSPLSVALLPPPSLLEVYKAMAAIATLANQQNIDDDDIFLGKYIEKNSFFFLFSFSIKNTSIKINYCKVQAFTLNKLY